MTQQNPLSPEDFPSSKEERQYQADAIRALQHHLLEHLRLLDVKVFWGPGQPPTWAENPYNLYLAKVQAVKAISGIVLSEKY